MLNNEWYLNEKNKYLQFTITDLWYKPKKKSKLNNLKNEMKKIHNTFAPSLNKQTKKYKKL